MLGISHIEVERDPFEGYFALVETDNGECVAATRRYGSWTTVPDGNGRFRDILPAVAAELQTAVRRLERCN